MLTTVATMLAPLIAVLGWFVAHQFNVHRDRLNKRRDLRIQYLLEAYRRLEAAANRDEKTEEQAIAFESAVADIQLLGTPMQIKETVDYLRQHVAGPAAKIDTVLRTLRNDLRNELGLHPVDDGPIVFRFSRDWSGDPVGRTDPVRAFDVDSPAGEVR